jgi:recombinational DNA repair protein RecR
MILSLQFMKSWTETLQDEEKHTELHRRATALFEGNYHLLTGALQDIETKAEHQMKLLEILPKAGG